MSTIPQLREATRTAMVDFLTAAEAFTDALAAWQDATHDILRDAKVVEWDFRGYLEKHSVVDDGDSDPEEPTNGWVDFWADWQPEGIGDRLARHLEEVLDLTLHSIKEAKVKEAKAKS